MKCFTIDNKTNSITIHASAKEAEAVPNSERFSSEAALLKLATNWPAARLVELWNSLPGENPVKKFKDRATAVTRVWKAIQTLGPTTRATADEPMPIPETPSLAEQATAETFKPDTRGAEIRALGVSTSVGAQAPDVAPAEPGSTRKAAKKPDTAQTGEPREGTKAAQVIAMLKRPEGATVEEIMATMNWLKHTTRALLSAGGSLTRNHGLTVTSEKVGETRRYYIKD